MAPPRTALYVMYANSDGRPLALYRAIHYGGAHQVWTGTGWEPDTHQNLSRLLEAGEIDGTPAASARHLFPAAFA